VITIESCPPLAHRDLTNRKTKGKEGEVGGEPYKNTRRRSEDESEITYQAVVR
jgi:hypothetical protein